MVVGLLVGGLIVALSSDRLFPGTASDAVVSAEVIAQGRQVDARVQGYALRGSMLVIVLLSALIALAVLALWAVLRLLGIL